MSDLPENLIVGTTTGVASGVILALFFWMRGRMSRFFERRDQIHHLRNLLVDYRSKILGAETIEAQLDGETVKFEKAEVQKAAFDEMTRRLAAVLDGRVTRLSFDEANSVRTIIVDFANLFPTVRLNDDAYRVRFGELEALKWLKLPPMGSSNGV